MLGLGWESKWFGSRKERDECEWISYTTPPEKYTLHEFYLDIIA
jgi:hypothetical protein